MGMSKFPDNDFFVDFPAVDDVWVVDDVENDPEPKLFDKNLSAEYGYVFSKFKG